MSLAIFISDAASVLSAPLREHERVVRGERGELVRARSTNGSPVSSAIFAARALGELGVRVEPGADGGAADGELVEPGQRELDALEVGVELRDVAAELLAERERHRVLQVRAADLDDVVELLGLGRERVAQRAAPPGRAGARPPRPRRCASRSGTCRSTTATCSRRRSGGRASCCPRSPPASSMARLEITSLTFMFVCVPLPVCQTKSGNSSSSLPGDDLVGRLHDQRRPSRPGACRGPRLTERGGLLQDRHAADHRAAACGRRRSRSGAATAGSARPSSGRRGPRSGPCCRSRCGCSPSASLIGEGTPSLAHRFALPLAVAIVPDRRSMRPAHVRAEQAGARASAAVWTSAVMTSRSRSMPRTIACATRRPRAA